MRSNIIDKIVYMTPKELDELGIGVNTKAMFSGDEEDDRFPILLNDLKRLTRESIYGTENKTSLSFPIEGSDSCAFICVEINGKLCKLNETEWDIQSGNRFRPALPLNLQSKIFQRLILEGQITLADLAADDIDTTVYKSLVLNELDGDTRYRQKIDQLDRLWTEQQEDETIVRLDQKVRSVL